MKKSLLLLACMMLALGGIAAATPLTDYSPGNVDINLNLGWAIDGSGANGGGKISSFINQDFNNGSGGAFDLGITVGLGNNIALRLKNNTFSGNTYTWDQQWLDPWWCTGDSVTGYLTDTEFDVMWQACSLDRTPFSLTALIGFDAPVLGAIGSSSAGNTYQASLVGGGILFGLQGVVPVGDTTSVFATGDIGTSHWGVGAGVGFALSQNVDFNLGVDYRSYFMSALNSNFGGTVSSCQPKIGIDVKF